MFIIRWIIKWAVLAGAVILAAYLVPGITIVSWQTALLAAVILGLINVFIKPILFILTIPINIITLGFFGIILNALLFWFGASLVNGFAVSNFAAAFFGSLIVSIIMWIINAIVDRD